MENNAGDLIIGLMMAFFGLVGLFLISGAADTEMYVFGISLTGFAVAFDFGLIKHHYDRLDAIRAKVRDNTHV